jgi:hypothetical protein
MILHYFYYAGMITYTPENKFAIPNNDVLLSYEHLLFWERETDYYIDKKRLNVKMCAGNLIFILNFCYKSIKKWMKLTYHF